jgi:hypothetical protein
MNVAAFMRSMRRHPHNIAIRLNPLLAENLFVDGEGPAFTDQLLGPAAPVPKLGNVSRVIDLRPVPQ